ncbi:hypothetical protein [Streptomyces sp. 5-10]|uniref:hypothetical protein n=1 Tax=Streptomyces sp. 5-10 TaxID=878925 RepID=UPI00168B8414|nr:hypothetical protein [Streptomyces sp. 5-10]MBD3004624.1 hypothetical protein [Streptomyces sp. 5-10]
MYFYAQYWSERTGTWYVEGDQYRSIDEAAKQLGRMRDERPGEPADHFRIAVYLTPLTSDNAALRVAR